MTPTPRPPHAAPAPSPANQTTDGAPVADQPAWSYSSPPKATDYGTGAFAHDSHSGKWQRIGPDNKPYGDLIDDQRNGQPRVATDPFGPHVKMDYVPDTHLGRSRMVFSDGTPVPTGKPVYENDQKSKWLNNNDGTYTPLGKDGQPAGAPQTPSGFVRNADGKTAPVDDHGNQFMAKQDKLLPTLPNGQKMFHQPGTDFYTPQAPDGSRMIINGNGKDPSYVDANNKPISPDQYHRALGQGGADGGEPKVTYPEGTPEDLKTQTDDVLHKIWQALGGSATPTGGVTRTPPGAPAPGAAGQSGATADAIEDSTLRQGVAHDAMVNADDRVQQILTDAAANQTATKQAVTNMVSSLNDDLAALPPDTADSQASLMERINTTLSDASAAVNKALSDAEGAGKNISKDTPAAGKDKDATADPKASTPADPDAADTPAPGPYTDPAASTGSDDGVTSIPDSTGGDVTSPSPTVSDPASSAPIAADSSSPPTDDPLATTPDPMPASPMSPTMNPYANPMGPMGMGGMNPYGGMMDPSMMGATNPLTSGLSGLSGLNPLGGAGTTPGLSGLSPTPTPTPSVTPPADTAPSVSSPPADSPSVSPAPSVSSPPADSTPAPAEPPAAADPAPTDQATPAPPEPAPTDPTAPAHPPAAADAPKPAEDRSVKLPDGTTHDAPNAAAAAAARHALEDKSGAGDAAQAAYANTDVKLPSDGKDLGAEVDPSDLQPGDIAKWDDHTAVVVGPAEIADHGEVKQLSEVMGTSSDSFEGFFRPTDAAGADVGGDPTAPDTDPGAADPGAAAPGADSGDSANAPDAPAPSGADSGDPAAPAPDSGDPSDSLDSGDAPAAGDDPSAQPSDPAATDPNLSTTPNSDPAPSDTSSDSSAPSAAPAGYAPASRYSAPPWRRV